MKLSLSWIFDHIASRKLNECDVHELLQSLGGMPAEIEHVHEVTISWDDFSLGKIIEISSTIILESAEWGKKLSLPIRADAQLNRFYLIKKEGSFYSWVSLPDLGSSKAGLVPELLCTEEELAGDWKKRCPKRDYILEIDNKSINNRPDLWSHRGVAREICALLGFEMKAEEHLIRQLPIQHYATKTDASAAYSIELESQICNRFAGLEISCNAHSCFTASLPWMVVLLARIDQRAYNLFVDATNYVMFDFGQPMHGFDAEKIHDKTIIVRAAHAGEKLVLLDDTTIELTPKDCVIADTGHALSLAGVMGGSESALNPYTTKIFLEAAHFDGTAIRLSSARHKKRTESSIRFEKVLDPHNNTTALLRYVKLLDDSAIQYTINTPIISIGSLAPERIITVEYRFIVDRLGISLVPTRIEELLRRLGFGVTVAEGVRGIIYTLIVPTWRAGKDITIKEDIIEEVGRCFGYTSIHPLLPSRVMIPQEYGHVYLRRKIKQHWAFALNMREVYNYSLYDEQFLQRIGLVIPTTFALKNPVSENARRMVNSLVPHLLKNIEQNCANEQTLRFFEWGHIWLYDEKKASTDEMKGIVERVVSAGVAYSAEGHVDFYEEKAGIQKLFNLLGLLVEWRPMSNLKNYALWMNPLKTAELVCQGKVIGYAGMVATEYVVALNRASGEKGKAFACGLFINDIESIQPFEKHFSEPSKYQSVDLDISMFVPLNVTVMQLEELLATVDARVKDVVLIDVFEQPSWHDKRSVTMRCRIQDDEKTMTKVDLEEIQAALHEAVKQSGAQIR